MFQRGRVWLAEVDVPQLATWPRVLAVEVQVRAGLGQDIGGRRDGADEIDHRGMSARRGVAQGESQNGAEMVLELAGDGAILRPVAGVVHAWRHLVCEQLIPNLEPLD